MHDPHSPTDLLTPPAPLDVPIRPIFTPVGSRGRCAECEGGYRVEGAEFNPGDRVMCRRMEEGLRGGRASIERYAGTVKSVLQVSDAMLENGTGSRRSKRMRGIYCHVLFDDGVCQTLESKYLKQC